MYTYTCHNIYLMDQMVKSLPAVWETWVWPPGEGNDNPLQYSCLENSMDRGIWWGTVHGIAKSQPWLNTSAQHLQLYENKMDNLEAIDKFLEKYNFPKQNSEEIENTNIPIISTEIKTVIKIF